MIKGVIFDLGGVLVDNPASDMRSYISNNLGISEKEFIKTSYQHHLGLNESMLLK